MAISAPASVSQFSIFYYADLVIFEPVYLNYALPSFFYFLFIFPSHSFNKYKYTNCTVFIFRFWHFNVLLPFFAYTTLIKLCIFGKLENFLRWQGRRFVDARLQNKLDRCWLSAKWGRNIIYYMCVCFFLFRQGFSINGRANSRTAKRDYGEIGSKQVHQIGWNQISDVG